MVTIAVFSFVMMLPLSTILSPSKNKYGLLMIYTIALAIVGLIAIVLTFSTGDLMNVMSGIFFFVIMAFQWIANYRLIMEDNL